VQEGLKSLIQIELQRIDQRKAQSQPCCNMQQGNERMPIPSVGMALKEVVCDCFLGSTEAVSSSNLY